MNLIIWFQPGSPLEVLDIEGCELPLIPHSIRLLSNLTALQVVDNCLTYLPACLTLLPKLRILEYGGNPIYSPPMSIQTQGLPAVIGYLRDLRQHSRLDEVKVRCHVNQTS